MSHVQLYDVPVDLTSDRIRMHISMKWALDRFEAKYQSIFVACVDPLSPLMATCAVHRLQLVSIAHGRFCFQALF